MLEIEQQMDGCPISASNLENYINQSIEISTELPYPWASGSYCYKYKLQKLLFTDGIYYNEQKDETRTTKINSVFLLIASLNSTSGQKNNGLQSDFSLKSVSVPESRLELPTFGL